MSTGGDLPRPPRRRVEVGSCHEGNLSSTGGGDPKNEIENFRSGVRVDDHGSPVRSLKERSTTME